MSAGNVASTAHRVLLQLRNDPRTIALLVAVPVVLLSLTKWVFLDRPAVFQRVGVPMLGVFPLVSMFLVTSITMLRERVTGTLERLLTLPLAKLDLLLGYALAFAAFAVVQGVVASTVAFTLLDLDVAGPIPLVIALAVLNAVLGMSLGLLVSAFAQTEFQAVQFMPAVILPQFLLSGLLTPRSTMARPLELLSDILPMSYAYDALAEVTRESGVTGDLVRDVVLLVVFTVAALGLGAATLRRRSA